MASSNHALRGEGTHGLSRTVCEHPVGYIYVKQARIKCESRHSYPYFGF